MLGEKAEVLDGPSGGVIGSLAITESELVLYYLWRTTTVAQVQVSTRASINDPFGPGAPVPELTSLCTMPDVAVFDITSNGLDAYVTCAGQLSCGPQGCTVQHASRAATTDPFVVQVPAGAYLGSSPSIAEHQLTIYTSALEPAAGAPLVLAERTITTSAFGQPQDIPGSGQWTRAVVGIEVSADEVELYGHSVTPTVQLLVSRRASVADPFPEPASLAFGVGGTNSASLTPDCKALYFVSVVSQQSTNVYVARR